MDNIGQKLASSYWLKKVRGTFKANEFSLKEMKNIKETINTNDLLYFSKLTKDNSIVEYTTLLSVFNALLFRYFDVESLLYSSKIGDENTPLLFNFSSIKDKTLKEYLQKNKEEVQEVYRYINYESKIKEECNFEDYAIYGFLYNTSSPLEELKALVPFLFLIKKSDKGLELGISYDNSFVDDYVAIHFLQTFKNWVSSLEVCISVSIEDISIVTENEKHQLLEEFNNTKKEFSKGKTIIDLFENQVNNTPKNIAVLFEEKEIPYQELNEKANQLANFLRQNFEVKSNDLVGVKLERNEDLLVAIIAVLKSGAAYVPIDVNYPEQRINYIEKDSNAKVIIDKNFIEEFGKERESYSKENLSKLNKPSDLAYIIYTSGTTGNPKGVMITNANAVAMIHWSQQEFDKSIFDVVYAVTSHCFDLSVYEIFYPFSIGKPIRLLNDALEIKSVLHKDANVLINTVPSSMRSLLEANVDLENISVVNLAGEPFPIDIANKLSKTRAQVRNLYGPSEDTTYSTVYKLNNNEVYVNSISIGRPIDNTQAYVLDENLKLLPVGVIGKLYLSGEGITNGYLNRPDLTKEKYIKNPFSPEKIMYDTGDLVRWTSAGTLEYFGRKDLQVKLRGYRIELGEIENRIVEYSSNVLEAIVRVKQVDNVDVLVGYYTSRVEIDKTSLRKYLTSYLPTYMVPTYFLKLKSIPLTPNGKVNTNELPEVFSEEIIRKEYVAPRNATEKELISIWEEVINVKGIGIKDNFFELGGHSLMIGQVINQIYKRLNGNITYKEFFKVPIVEDVAATIKEENYIAIPKTEEKDYYQLTPSQHRLWLLSQLEGGNIAYNMSGALVFKGELNVELFKKAFHLLIEKHEILRTYFKVNEEGEVHQYIVNRDALNFDVEFIDFKENTEEEIDIYIHQQQGRPFDLNKAPLLRGSLLLKADNEWLFSFVMHHIIGDGWSLELLMSDIIKTYKNLLENVDYRGQKLSVQYKDYSAWLQLQLKEKEYENSKAYWLNKFQGELPVLDLPCFKKRPIVKTYEGSTLNHQFSKEFFGKVKQFSKNHGVTVFMTLMAGINNLLYRYTDQEDIIIGTPIAGREHPDLENQIGMYLNTLAIRTKLEKDFSFESLLQQQKDTLLEAYEHQNYPFDELINSLNITRDTSRSALFDIMVIFQNQAQLHSIKEDTLIEGIEVEDYNIKRRTSQFDLSFVFVEKETLELSIEYNTDIYDEFLVKRIFTHYENLINQALENPNYLISEIDFISQREKEQLLDEFNRTKVNYPKNKDIIDLFEEQVVINPDNIAVVYKDKELTYKELNEKANTLAHYLRDQYAIQANDFVGVKLERSEQLLIAVLGVLKAGAAYVPIDVNYPQERINYLEKDSNCKIVIDEKELQRFKSVKQKYNSKNPEKTTSIDNLAYIIYTSGTTGNPKGVLISHHNLIALIYWAKLEFDVSKFDVVYAATSHCFDLSAYEMFFPLSIGKTVKMFKNILEIEEDLFLDRNILINTVPSSLLTVLEEKYTLKNVTIVNLAGEAFPADISKKLRNTAIEVRNLYGPSEDTTYSTCYTLNKEKEYDSIPIGKPICNTKAYVLDEKLQLLPIGVRGKLYLTGDGLSKGYLNKSELTKEKFIPNPFEPGTKLYNTGDIVRFLPNGTLEYIGRQDSQVKVNGYRIELGEIENQVLSFSDKIKRVIIDVRRYKGNTVLVCYYVGAIDVSVKEIKNYLREYLPKYMVPQHFVKIDTVPLTPNGKIDRTKLPDNIEDYVEFQEYIVPKEEDEKRLAEIWKETLNIQNVSINDDFFELGGHSLKLTQLINKIEKEFEVKVSFEKLFDYSSLQDQLKLIKESDKVNSGSIKPVKLSDNYEMSYAQKSLWMVSQFQEKDRAYNMPALYKFEGALEKKSLEKAFQILVDKHEILRTVFKEDEEFKVKQYVIPSEVFNFSINYLETTKNNNDFELNQTIQAFINEPFDLVKGPLLRVHLIKITEEEHLLLFTMHHIICDEWSFKIIINEIGNYYNTIINNEEVIISPLDIQYKDYSCWLKNQIHNQNIVDTYWKNELKGKLKPLPLMYDNKDKSKASFEGSRLTFNIDEETALVIKKNIKKYSFTKFTFHFAAYVSFLHVLTQEKDIVLGVPFAGRGHYSLEDQIGYYVNLLPIRTGFTSENYFIEILHKVHQKLSNAFENQMYPMDLVMADLDFDKQQGGASFINTGFTWSELDYEEIRINNDLKISIVPIETQLAKHDLWIISNGSHFILEYRKDLFNEDTILLFIERYKMFLKEISKNPNKTLSDYDFSTSEEKKIESSKISIEINF